MNIADWWMKLVVLWIKNGWNAGRLWKKQKICEILVWYGWYQVKYAKYGLLMGEIGQNMDRNWWIVD